MNFAKKLFVATALTGFLATANLGAAQAGDFSPGWKPMKPLYDVLTGFLAMANLGAVQAGDSSSGWKPIKPLYAVSFDVGRKHVLSYFLNKNGQCDLTTLVTDRPDEAAEGDEIPTLNTTRFKATINGGKTAHLDIAEGKSLEYACAADAHAMGVRQVSPVAVASPHPQRRINKVAAAGLGG